jgi:hypothetical protein
MSDARKAAEEIAKYIRNVCLVSQGLDAGYEYYIPHLLEILAAAHSPTYSEGRRAGLLEAAQWHDDMAASYKGENPPPIPLGEDYGDSDMLAEIFKQRAESHRLFATAIRALAEGDGA